MSDSNLPPYVDEGRRPNPRRLARQAQMDHLANVPLLAGCSKRELRRLAQSSRLDLLEAGQRLITEGQASFEAYVIVAGTATVRRKGRKVATVAPGDVVGELGLILRRPRESTVTADTPLEVLVLERQALRAAVDDVPGLAWKLLETVADRMTDNATSRKGKAQHG